MENKEIQLKVIEYLQTELRTNLEYVFGNGYSIFEFGDDAVCHFSLPKRKDWKFGIWINGIENDKYSISLFGQYIDYIDKFKPSCCTISYNVKLDKDFENLDDELYDFVNDLNNVKDSNWASLIKYYWYGYYGAKNNPIKWLLNDFYFYKIRKNVLSFWNNNVVYLILKTRVFVDRVFIGRNFNKIEIVDNNKNGWICSPRYDVKYNFKNTRNDNTYRLYKFINRHNYKNASIRAIDEDNKGFCYVE